MTQTVDFDLVIDRSGTDSVKWGKYAQRNVIPMWVADMDFAAPAPVIEALHQRTDHGIFGYAAPGPDLAAVVVDHLQQTYQWNVAPDWIVWLPGLVSGLNVACRSMTRSGVGVATTLPVYPPFLSAPKLSQQILQTTTMVYQPNHWHIDFFDLEAHTDERTSLFLLCNPHNPTGRMFDKQELLTLAEICLRHRWIICSDEIHCDLIMDPKGRHIPIASLDPQINAATITLMAPSKTYNMPGLGCAFAIIADDGLRRRFKQAMAGIVPHVNVLGLAAAKAAYTHGRSWLDQLLVYLRQNRDMVYQWVESMPGLSMGQVQATYLAWIDARAASLPDPVRFFEAAGVGLSDGTDFGAPGFLRLNFGCPRTLLTSALNRMTDALNTLN